MARIIKQRVSDVNTTLFTHTNTTLLDKPKGRVNNVFMRATEDQRKADRAEKAARYARVTKDLGIRTPTELYVFIYGERPPEGQIARVSNWKSRGIPGPVQPLLISKIKEKKLGDLNALWLLSGKGEMWHARPPRGLVMSDDESQGLERCEPTTSVRCLDLERDEQNLADQYQACTIREINVKEKWLQHHLGVTLPDCLCIREMLDRSMHPMIKQGEFIFIDTCITEIHFDGIYVISIDDELYIRHVVRSPGKLNFSSEQPGVKRGAFEIKRAELGKVRIHGKVVGSWALRRL